MGASNTCPSVKIVTGGDRQLHALRCSKGRHNDDQHQKGETKWTDSSTSRTEQPS